MTNIMKSSIITKYFPTLSEHQKQQFEELFPLYEDWNSKINVISRKDIEDLYLHHVLHSLSIYRLMTILHMEGSAHSILDVGTGGGFPGIPLAIMMPDKQFTLCDSIGKKIRVVTEISISLGLDNLTPICARAETLTGKYDIVVSRAVSSISDFIPLVSHLYRDGIIMLKGGDTQGEISAFNSSGLTPKLRFSSYDITDWFKEPFFEEKRVILAQNICTI